MRKLASLNRGASPVNPSHYVSHKITPIDLIEEYDLNFKLGNVIKYVARHEEKDGRADLCKGLWYLLRELGLPKSEITELTERLREIPEVAS
jgi:hypothetical protein